MDRDGATVADGLARNAAVDLAARIAATGQCTRLVVHARALASAGRYRAGSAAR